MKKCTKCGLSKPLENFSRSRQKKCGRNSWCKKCQVINNHKYEKYFKKYHKEHYNGLKRYGISVKAIQLLGLKLALNVYDRAKRKCEKCSATNDLTIHHIDGNGRHNQEKKLKVNNNSDNLQVLCRKCHGSIHGKESRGISKKRK